MVPVSVRRPDQRGALNNQVSAVFVDLPVGEPDPIARLSAVRGQMDEYKRAMQAVDAPSIIAMGDFVAPALLSLGVRATLQAGQFWCQAVTTNVPGPRVPLYVLGRRMVSANAYVPIAGGTRCSIGIFSYLNTMTFGINADFDAFPDVDVLSGGIRAGIDELLALAGEKAGDDAPAEEPTAPERAAPAAGRPRGRPPPGRRRRRRRLPADEPGTAAGPARRGSPRGGTARRGRRRGGRSRGAPVTAASPSRSPARPAPSAPG